MKSGLDIDKCEFEREIVLQHKHFVEALNNSRPTPGPRTGLYSTSLHADSASGSTLPETDRKPPVAPRGSSRLSQQGQASGPPNVHDAGYLPMHLRRHSAGIPAGQAGSTGRKSSRPQLLQHQKIDQQVREEIEDARHREAFKPPSKNREAVLEHFYRLQKNELKRLGKFDLDDFAANCFLRRIKLKAMMKLKAAAFRKSELARTMAALKKKKKVFLVLKKMGVQRMKRRAREKQMQEIY